MSKKMSNVEKKMSKVKKCQKKMSNVKKNVKKISNDSKIVKVPAAAAAAVAFYSLGGVLEQIGQMVRDGKVQFGAHS